MTLAVVTWTSVIVQSSKQHSCLPHSTSGVGPSSCGTSTFSAREMGCNFDIMSFSWLPPACFDEQLMQDFLDHENGPWIWYHDQNRTQQAEREFVLLGNYPQLYVEWDYHMAHCAFMWRKMHRAVLEGRPLDSYILDMHHTQHCERTLLRTDIDEEVLHTAISMKWPICQA